jgi:hypothetical protein
MAVAEKWQPQLASSSGEQHGHDDTCDHHHHRADRFRGRRLVRAGTVVVRQLVSLGLPTGTLGGNPSRRTSA